MKIVKIVGGVVLVGLVLWGVISLTRSGSTKTAAVPPPAEPSFTLVALDSVRVHVEQKNLDSSIGAVVLPETTLVRGETRVVPRRGAVYISAIPSQNLSIEINGRRFPIPDNSDRGELPAP